MEGCKYSDGRVLSPLNLDTCIVCTVSLSALLRQPIRPQKSSQFDVYATCVTATVANTTLPEYFPRVTGALPGAISLCVVLYTAAFLLLKITPTYIYYMYVSKYVYRIRNTIHAAYVVSIFCYQHQ